MVWFRVVSLCLAGAGLAGCDLPRDPEGTLESVKGRELRVGILHGGADSAGDRPVAERLAASLGARAVYVEGDAHALFESLQHGGLHLVIGGVPRSTPFAPHLGLSKPVGPLHGSREVDERVLAVRPGENAFLMRVNRTIAEVAARGDGP